MNVYNVINKYDGKTAGQLFLIEMARSVVFSLILTVGVLSIGVLAL